jgi:hypothetical protein
MNCVKHNFFEPGYQCKDCTIEDLRARVAELEAAVEAYKSEVATCHRNEWDRIRYREALEKIQGHNRFAYAGGCIATAREALNL